MHIPGEGIWKDMISGVCIGFMLCTNIIVPHQVGWPHVPCDMPHATQSMHM